MHGDRCGETLKKFDGRRLWISLPDIPDPNAPASQIVRDSELVSS